ncbi:LysM peptidoglycan-binding domain-containing protein [Tabrizicola sp. BL-A-41-H6]|uniref:LysM peptidoglycan-binding domain-containing protein n=1 Tax=Tabrizicola sp. BL-A-41-H6 TaxID=3421107 RepID=UPI003D66ACE0
MGTPSRTVRTGLGHTALALALMTTAASAQELCSFHTVVPGDTLSQLAKAAGVAGGYQILYSANRDRLSSPNIIEVGMTLAIPCADGSLPGASTAAAEPAASDQPALAAALETAAEPAVEPTTKPVAAAAPATTKPALLPEARFLTAGSYAPFTDEDLPEGGMFTELVKLAMQRAAPNQPYRVSFVNDWGAHLTELLPSGAFDLGFPWYLPDCSKVDLLSPATQMRCTDYDASDPFFEAVVGYYTKAGSDLVNVTSHDQLKGKRLCRPDGWFTFDLEALGLVEPNVSMLVAPTQLDCWRALEADEVDVVTFDALPAEDDIVTLGIGDNVKELTALATVQTIHVFTPKANPDGKAYLAILNAGLKSMRDDGTWFKVVSTRLREHEEKQASGG